MRYVVLVPDGAADYPLDELDGQTPLEAAAAPCMDRLAREGAGGLVQMIPGAAASRQRHRQSRNFRVRQPGALHGSRAVGSR